MNIMAWNIQGLTTSFARLNHLVRVHKLYLLALIEPKHPLHSITRYGMDLGFSDSHASGSGKIWVYWQSHALRLLSFQDDGQILHLQFNHTSLNIVFTCSMVYAGHTVLLRRQLWAFMRSYSQQIQCPWLICGDFNTFRSLEDHMGRSQPSLSMLQDFNDCIEDCSLMSPSFHGPRYTWTDGRGLGLVKRRLDWVFMNSPFHDVFDDLRLTHLPRVSSDHTPLLIIFGKTRASGHQPFRFLDAWLAHPDFHAYVANAWNSYPTTGGMHGFYIKLSRLRRTSKHGIKTFLGMCGLYRILFTLKKDLRWWNKDLFGNIFDAASDAEARVVSTEAQYDNNPTEGNRTKYHEAKAVLLQVQNQLCQYWKQNARVKWLQEGEVNSSYFHALVKARRRKQYISRIISLDGDECVTEDAIQRAAVQFYTKLFAEEQTENHDDILKFIPLTITDEDNDMLTDMPQFSEVKAAVWNLDPSSVAGPDGFHGKFFRQCWDIVCLDVLKAVQEFFIGVKVPQAMEASMITLIPRINNPTTYADFRPISLTNFVSKVVT